MSDLDPDRWDELDTAWAELEATAGAGIDIWSAACDQIASLRGQLQQRD